MNFVAGTLQPLSVVETEEYRDIMEVMDPRYIVPCRKHLSTKLIPNKCEDLNTVMCTALRRTSSVSVTVDIWNSRQMREVISELPHITSPLTGNNDQQCWHVNLSLSDTQQKTYQHSLKKLSPSLIFPQRCPTLCLILRLTCVVPFLYQDMFRRQCKIWLAMIYLITKIQRLKRILLKIYLHSYQSMICVLLIHYNLW